MQKTNIYAACILLCLSLFSFFWLIPNFTKPAQSALDIPASFMPKVACALIIILTISMLLRAYVSWKKGLSHDENDNDELRGEITGIGKQEAINIAIWSGFSIVALLGLNFLGFYITVPVLLAAAMLYTGCRKPLLIGIVSLLAPILVGQLVWHAFTISMP